MQRFLTWNFTKICLTVCDVHEEVHLWPHTKYALLRNNMTENQIILRLVRDPTSNYRSSSGIDIK
jgi:hypothetical protein